jgi:hypothetical protein
VISGFRREVDENCDLLGCYTGRSGKSLPIGCPETSVGNYHYSLRNNPEKRSSRVDILFVIMVHGEKKVEEHWLTPMDQLTQDFASSTISVKTTQ